MSFSWSLSCLLLLTVILGQQTAEDFLSKGDLFLSQSSFKEAVEAYQKGIQILTENDESLLTEISLYTNLGTALSSLGQNEEAITSYQTALTVYETQIHEIVDTTIQQHAQAIVAETAFFLGMVYQDIEQPKEAVQSYIQAHSLDPYHWAAYANLGGVYHDELSNYPAALAAYNKAYNLLTSYDEEIEPTDPPPEPRPILSQLQYRIGLCLTHDPNRQCQIQDDNMGGTPADCSELAAHAFALAVQLDPYNEAAKHMLATLTADATLKRASNDYVKSLFDDYAKNFEHSLVQELGYNGYERLRKGFDRAFQDKTPVFERVVDAGCGTGLVGEQFRNVSHYLIGVDLSEVILQKAVEMRPHLYNETIAADVVIVFRERKPISLIVAGDSYIYFGDLAPLFDAMQEGLEHGGYAAFTLENVSAEAEATLEESKPDWRWQLTPSGRFAHRKEYVVSIGTAYDLSLVHYESLDGFRHERGEPVRGHLFVFQKRMSLDQEL